jgi:hypothetical protein
MPQAVAHPAYLREDAVHKRQKINSFAGWKRSIELLPYKSPPAGGTMFNRITIAGSKIIFIYISTLSIILNHAF